MSRILGLLLLGVAALKHASALERSSESSEEYYANINVTKRGSSQTPVVTESFPDRGKYSDLSVRHTVSGHVVHVVSLDTHGHANDSLACTSTFFNVPAPSTPWIALVERGECPFNQKIENAVKRNNASAIIVYDKAKDQELVTMTITVEDTVAVFVDREFGLRLIKDLQMHSSYVQVTISEGTRKIGGVDNGHKTSILFVCVSFVVLMAISLAWLIFYYVQRFRYAHAKEGMQRRLFRAATKALHNLPVRTLKPGDPELSEEALENCAVCLEVYRPAEIVRKLLCRHVFHKACVDPWLLEHRSCPMCKGDILKPFGLQSARSSGSASSGGGGPVPRPLAPTPDFFSTSTSDHVYDTATPVQVLTASALASDPSRPPGTPSGAEGSSPEDAVIEMTPAVPDQDASDRVSCGSSRSQEETSSFLDHV